MQAYFWCTNVFSRVSDPPSLYTANLINSLIPGPLDEVLELQNAWCTSWKLFQSLGTSTLDIRDEHLDIPVATEAALLLGLADMQSGRVAIIGFFDRAIQGRKLSENWNDARGFVFHLFLLD